MGDLDTTFSEAQDDQDIPRLRHRLRTSVSQEFSWVDTAVYHQTWDVRCLGER